MVSNVLKCENSIKAFEQAINEQRQEWEDEEAENAERAQELVIQVVLRDNPNGDPDDVPIQTVIPRKLLCQQTMERCLNKVISVILPMDAVLEQE